MEKNFICNNEEKNKEDEEDTCNAFILSFFKAITRPYISYAYFQNFQF